MSNAWKVRLDGALRGGEVAGLYFTTALLIVVEFCFVYWLNRIQIPDVPNVGIRVHRSAAVVSEAALRSDAAAHDPGGSVVFGLLGALGSVAKENRHGIVGEGHSVGQTTGQDDDIRGRADRLRAGTGHLASSLTPTTGIPQIPRAAQLEVKNHDSRFLPG